MGRPRKILETNELEDTGGEDFKPVGVAPEAIGGRGDDTPISVSATEQIAPKPAAGNRRDDEESEVARLRAEVERLRGAVENSFEDAIKDKHFGTRMYLTVTRSSHPDYRNPALMRYNRAALSVFPDCVDKVSGIQVAPDIGFDNRKQADAMRQSDEIMDFEGDKIPIKDAVRIMQRRYFERKREGDRVYLERLAADQRRS